MSRRDCLARLARIFEYTDGDLSPARARALQTHLRACKPVPGDGQNWVPAPNGAAMDA
ncbi:MAG: zf-HC2 domain-containing protein [Acidobacteria bacterium]|nr:zf-HC2 domain-containing protein [Acidobacteriota bacterium]